MSRWHRKLGKEGAPRVSDLLRDFGPRTLLLMKLLRSALWRLGAGNLPRRAGLQRDGEGWGSQAAASNPCTSCSVGIS